MIFQIMAVRILSARAFSSFRGVRVRSIAAAKRRA
jgi:hypothetical protein